jgi:phosphonate transport system ATP-binding protein
MSEKYLEPVLRFHDATARFRAGKTTVVNVMACVTDNSSDRQRKSLTEVSQRKGRFMLEINGLSRRFGDKTAVDDVTLTINRGAFIGVIGRSGAGKSTLLRMVNRLVDPSAGRIAMDGRDVTALKGQALRDWRAGCAMVFQQFNLVGRLDVLTNVMMGRLNRMPSSRSLLKLWSAEDRAIALTPSSSSTWAPSRPSAPTSSRAASSSASPSPERLVQGAAHHPRRRAHRLPSTRATPALVMDALARINRDYGITVLCNLHSLDLARAYCGRTRGNVGGACRLRRARLLI